MIEANLIHCAHLVGVPRLMFRGSSCICPRDCPQPTREDYLLTGLLEPTIEPYAIAKNAGSKLAESHKRQYERKYVSVMPTNLYEPSDNYDLQNNHVRPTLPRNVHEARLRGDVEPVVWGTDTPRREFLFVDDLADACVHLMGAGYAGPLVSISTGEDLTICELAETVMQVLGVNERVVYDATKPDGAPRRLLEASRSRARVVLSNSLARWHCSGLRRLQA